MATTLLSIAATTTAAAVIIISLLLSKAIKIIRCIHTSRRKRRCKEEEKKDNNNRGSTDDASLLQPCRCPTSTSSSSIKTVIFLGSGGHTTEMIQLVQQLDTTVYAPIIYIVGENDVTSIPRLQRYISSLKNEGEMNNSSEYCRRHWEGRYPHDINDDKNTTTTTTDDPTILSQAHVYTLPRAREVHQSYLSSIFTTLYSTYKTLQLLYTIRPNLIMTNGPGTCVPLVYCAFVLRLWFSLMNDDTTKQSTTPSNNSENNKRRSNHHHLLYRTIFIESICRVKTLSLSGKLVYPIVDSFMVHWPNLMERYGMVENCDVFVSSLITTSDEDGG